ncbi:MATE family efflux transporter [Pseudogemmobacter faecipullorum]|uniref:Multidrug-efflux transporter n=1 Tax=Pseudogemmobacter faecipullorum TaxID=2755041 RepID=A0ABS8CGB1_9RHOB|nr:MATE family efflux transporter [Pseudogemmobacter faecipullorum]MCB5408416.1 MATE family efflux transporter [Pseudogemmobacter faecipullorum]
MIQKPLSVPGHIRATLILGLPLVGAAVAQVGLHVVNTAMVGWYSVIAQSGLVIATSSYFILFMLGTGFGRAVMPLAASAKARGDETELRRSARMGLWLSLGYGIVIYPVFWFSEPILLLLHQPPEVAREAQAYLRIAGLSLGPGLSVLVLQGWLAALGRTQFAFWLTVSAIGVNSVINWFLIFGNGGAPVMGVAGAGVATLSVQLFSLLCLALYAALLPSLRGYQLFRRFWRADWPAMGQVWRLGLPIGLTGLAETGLFEASAIMMGWLGAAQLAAHGIALEITALAFMAHVGLSNAATIRVASYQGMHDAFGLRRAALVALAISGSVVCVVIAVFLTWPEVLVRQFLDLNKADSAFVLSFGAVLLGYAALFQLADAMQVMALGLLRGIQDTKVPMVLAAVSYWLIGVPASYVLAFPLGWGGPGLWLGLVVGLFAAGLSLMLRFWLLAPKPGMAGKAAL